MSTRNGDVINFELRNQGPGGPLGGGYGGGNQIIRCESEDNRRRYCGQFGPNVALNEQISNAPCVQGRSWGVDNTGRLWVDDGCRATFRVQSYGGGGGGYEGGYGGGGYGGGDVRTIKCESENNRRRYCGNFPGQYVSIRERISDAECIEGRSWGADSRGLWVDRGCRAIFSVGRYSRSDDRDRGWWERDRDRDNSWPPSGDWRGRNWDSGGACFYRDDNFGGSYFCMRRGEEREGLAGYGDQITSIRVFGNARVVVFDKTDFRGSRQVISGDVNNLRNVGHGNRNWNNRISSIRVE